MKNAHRYPYQRNAQTAIEYMLLLAVVVAIVLVAFKVSLPKTQRSANAFFDRATLGLIGKPNPCGDGFCCHPYEDFYKCRPDCNSTLTPSSCPP